MLVTCDVSNPLKSKAVRLLQSLNMYAILVTFDVLNLLRSRLVILQSANI